MIRSNYSCTEVGYCYNWFTTTDPSILSINPLPTGVKSDLILSEGGGSIQPTYFFIRIRIANRILISGVILTRIRIANWILGVILTRIRIANWIVGVILTRIRIANLIIGVILHWIRIANWIAGVILIRIRIANRILNSGGHIDQNQDCQLLA